jgi:hypothetical protein
MKQLLGTLITVFMGAKIGNEVFRYRNPDSGYKPPPFFSLRLLKP